MLHSSTKLSMREKLECMLHSSTKLSMREKLECMLHSSTKLSMREKLECAILRPQYVVIICLELSVTYLRFLLL